MYNSKLELLRNILGSYYTHSGKNGIEYLFYCPFCKHYKKKLSINLQKGKQHCWVCNTAGSITVLIKKIGSQETITKWLELNNDYREDSEIDLKTLITGSLENNNRVLKNEQNKCTNIQLPGEYISLINNFSITSCPARNYLYRRNLEENDIIKWKIGYAIGGEYNNRIIIPSFGVEGNLEYYITRSYYNEKPIYKNLSMSKDIIFNEINVDFFRPIFISEGVFDAIICGDNSIPILGSSLNENSKLTRKLIESKSDVYLVLDPDAFYKEIKIAKMLIEYGLKVFKINVLPFKDVGEMSRREFRDRKRSAIFLNDNMFSYCMERRINERRIESY